MMLGEFPKSSPFNKSLSKVKKKNNVQKLNIYYCLFIVIVSIGGLTIGIYLGNL